MSEVRPLRAWRFARDPAPRLARPYDVISASEREALAEQPENIVHLTLPPGPQGERDYDAAARTLARWRADGVLVRDPSERLYVLEERTPEGLRRRGLLALLRLVDYAERVVMPHERTMAGPKRDRLLLTRAVEANLEPLFFLYEDRDGKLDAVLDAGLRTPPLARCAGPDGTHLTLGALSERGPIASVRAFLADRPVLIADGHHRYETLLAYRDERRAAAPDPSPEDPHEFVLACLVNAFDPGSQVRAIHRVLEGPVADAPAVLRGRGFRLEALDRGASAAQILERLRARGEREHAFVIVSPGAPAELASHARGAQLDVEVLHEELLPELGGTLSFDARPERLLGRVAAGEVSLGIFLNPIDPDALFRVVQAGGLLPQKSTFFSPKIPSGLVVRTLD